MDVYSVLLKRSAIQELESIPLKDRRRILSRLAALAEEPRPRGCEKLSGEDKFRIRQGPCRVIYLVEDRRRQVVVYKIGHRRDVYA